ncbi:hypothetical protein [Nocardia camponoti]|uniref:Uncharacterized protein n=1 Tax=Nocardia camponoti TaxID=1616106 RepID=A0A917QHV8_9NOCA|nr:hypothetical protein [Nocardia camponoti]GGK52015.1 hypothetical protein GCM10011591_24610 [Nocardia camponoti]
MTIAVLLFALAGFLIGGAIAFWKTNRPASGALGVAAILAVAGALLWMP